MGSGYGIENIHFLLPYEPEVPPSDPDIPDVPTPPISTDRFVHLLAQVEPGSPLDTYISGDAVISLDDLTLYGVDTTNISDDVRQVVVFYEGEPIPSDVETGDLVYNKTTNDLFRVGA